MRGATRIFWMMTWRRLGALLSIGFLLLGPGSASLLWAGGALLVMGPPGGFPGGPWPDLAGKVILFDATVPVSYFVDGGDMATGTTIISNAAGNARVDSMFQVWQDVETASIEFQNAGAIPATAGFADGDVSTLAEWTAVGNDAFNNDRTFVVFDADGGLFVELGFGSLVIGFAGPISLDPFTGEFGASQAALNGKFQNGGPDDLTTDDFNGAFIHEFGHMFGMDHSQINLNCRSGGCVNTDDAFGLPTMFPSLTNATEGGAPAILTLSEDDKAWVSKFYPETVTDVGKVPFNTVYGTIEGTVFFSDGLTQAQGVNVIARLVDDPATMGMDESRRFAVSNVSGWLITDSPGQNVTGTNTGGSLFGGRDGTLLGSFSIPAPVGEYTVEVESVFPLFVDGSSVGPLISEQIPMPGGVPEFYSGGAETDSDQPRTSPSDTVTVMVTAGATATGIDIILNGTIARFDAFESAGILPGPELAPPQPLWTRKDDSELTVAGETA